MIEIKLILLNLFLLHFNCICQYVATCMNNIISRTFPDNIDNVITRMPVIGAAVGLGFGLSLPLLIAMDLLQTSRFLHWFIAARLLLAAAPLLFG